MYTLKVTEHENPPCSKERVQPGFRRCVFRLLLSHQSAGLFLRVEKAQAHSLALSSNGLKILWLGIHI